MWDVGSDRYVFFSSLRQVFIIFRPAARLLIFPRPPGIFAARFFAAAILPPLDFFAII
jgi:hypothetical protein